MADFSTLKSWLDSQPERFKTPPGYPTHDGAGHLADGSNSPLDKDGKPIGNPLPQDGYWPTGQLWNILRHPTGTKPNPAIPKIAKPLDPSEIMATVSKANRTKCIQAGTLGPIQDAIVRQDRPGLAALGQMGVDAGLIDAAEFQAIGSLLQATIDDPSAPATVPTTDLETQFGVTDIDDESVKAEIDKALGRQ